MKYERLQQIMNAIGLKYIGTLDKQLSNPLHIADMHDQYYVFKGPLSSLDDAFDAMIMNNEGVDCQMGVGSDNLVHFAVHASQLEGTFTTTMLRPVIQ